MIIAQIILAFINVAMAAYHAHLFKQGKSVKHGLWAAGYLLLAIIVAWLLNSVPLLFLAVLIRKVVFDLSLNLFEGRPLFFVSRETTSVIDEAHYKLFGKASEWYMTIYFIGIILINVLC